MKRKTEKVLGRLCMVPGAVLVLSVLGFLARELWLDIGPLAATAVLFAIASIGLFGFGLYLLEEK